MIYQKTVPEAVFNLVYEMMSIEVENQVSADQLILNLLIYIVVNNEMFTYIVGEEKASRIF